MPTVGPIKRKDLIYYLRQVGFSGPYAGGKHEFVLKENLRVRIPNPHKGDIGRNLLMRILREAGIDKEEWGKTLRKRTAIFKDQSGQSFLGILAVSQLINLTNRTIHSTRQLKEEKIMPTVLFEAENRKVEVPVGTTLRKAAKKAGVSVYGGINKIVNCRGFGLCGTDKVAVAPADCLNGMTFFEKLQLGEKAKERLACQVKIQGDVVINTAPAIEYGKVMTENFKFIGLALPFGILTLGAIIYMVFEMVGKPLF